MFPSHWRTFSIVSGFNYYIFVVNEGNPPNYDDQISVGVVYNDARSVGFYVMFGMTVKRKGETDVNTHACRNTTVVFS